MGSLRKKGDRWYFSVELPQENGKRKRVERRGGKTKKEAQEKMKLFEAEVLKKGYKKESKMKFGELYDIWFTEYVLNNCRDNSIKSYDVAYRNHIKDNFDNYKIADITARSINDFFYTLKEKNISQSYASVIKVILSSCLDYAIFPLELIDSNPCKFIKLPKFDKIKFEKEVITMEDLKKILEAGSNKHNFNEVSLLLFNTGLRIGEALALQWEDIDFKERVIHVRHTLVTPSMKEYKIAEPKTKSSIRDVYFNDNVEKIFKSVKKVQNENRLKYGKFYKNNDLVFTNKDGSNLTGVYFVNTASKIRKDTGVNFTMHTFRHTHATMLLNSGANMKDIQTRLGHSDITTTMNVYVASTEEAKKKTLDKFDAYLEKTSNI